MDPGRDNSSSADMGEKPVNGNRMPLQTQENWGQFQKRDGGRQGEMARLCRFAHPIHLARFCNLFPNSACSGPHYWGAVVCGFVRRHLLLLRYRDEGTTRRAALAPMHFEGNLLKC